MMDHAHHLNKTKHESPTHEPEWWYRKCSELVPYDRSYNVQCKHHWTDEESRHDFIRKLIVICPSRVHCSSQYQLREATRLLLFPNIRSVQLSHGRLLLYLVKQHTFRATVAAVTCLSCRSIGVPV